MQFQNKVLIQGFLTKKPELKTTQNGKNYTRFSVCYNYSYKDKKTNDWVKIPYFLDVSDWNTSKVKEMKGTFYGCAFLTAFDYFV